MRIDCTTCVARHIACDDCVVSVLLGGPPDALEAAPVGAALELDDAEQVALGSLAQAGLVPPLRLVRALPDVQAERGIA
ncbi:hypothetical protein [uncultured Jatrophihabitans sp.]|uniref:hypothetical protein n=1 Tax=uncultured Jatrophihabitans sp. TaxID=1610747 RepID=UPI0035CB58F6